MKRIGFLIDSGSTNWLGGHAYTRNILTAIKANKDRTIEPVLFVPEHFDSDSLTGFPSIELVRASLVSSNHPARRASRLLFRLSNRDLILQGLLTKHRIDAVYNSGMLGVDSSLASIGWIPDFQHIRLPRYFNSDDIKMRNRCFRRLIDRSHCIILSSHDARKDFEGFAPDALGKSRVLHFVSCLSGISSFCSRDEIFAKYNIDRPYFHLPNQFWVHKNHATVIEAISILKKIGYNVLVCATGNTSDYRDPAYFSRLMVRVKELDVVENFRVLGVLPLEELYALMFNSVSLINPSSFEGWSTSVEEAKSFGLQIVLSDIPVHIEQSPPFARYFKSGSSLDLASAMLMSLREYDPVLRSNARKSALEELPGRIRDFGRDFEEIVCEAIRAANLS